jgi:hypothetical protein
MESNWAEENLQTIRTLMERSAVYRRALAPIMIFAGALGVVAAIAGFFLRLDSMRVFGILWLGTAVVAIAGAFAIARRQALKDEENFWSAPTRRVAQALFPALAAGAFLGTAFTIANVSRDFTLIVSLVWILFYGCALHAAGFFMPRGIRFFGCLCMASSCLLACGFIAGWLNFLWLNSYWLMGFFFGVLHLAYGAYLYLTEKKNPIA